jgi:HD-like signal output (HDOD) protein
MQTVQIADQLAAPATPPPVNAHAYEFVRQLAADLSGPAIELPSYPKVALRVQKLLTEENVTSDSIVRVLGAEPTLVGRILTLCNSAAHNPSGRPVADLRTAILRLGFDSLRSAVISFAMAQQREAPAFKAIQNPMRALWEHSVEVSALCFVLARLENRYNPDAALLTGVVSGVGKLYILTRASGHPQLFGDPTAYGEIVRNWHAEIAQAVLEQWQMAEEIVRAVRDFQDVDSEIRRNPNLADLLAAAHVMVECKDSPDLLQVKVSQSAAFARLKLDAFACQNLLAESAQEIAALRSALGE